MEYNCFTMFCSFLLYKKVNWLYEYIYPLPLEPLSHPPPTYPSGHHRALAELPELYSSFPLAIYFICGCVLKGVVSVRYILPIWSQERCSFWIQGHLTIKPQLFSPYPNTHLTINFLTGHYSNPPFYRVENWSLRGSVTNSHFKARIWFLVLGLWRPYPLPCGMLRFMGSQRVGHDWATELKGGQRPVHGKP